jgi:hypothetical protein
VSGELAAEKIVRILAAMNGKDLHRPNILREMRARMVSLARSKAARARRLLRPNTALNAYMDQKFPDLTLGELQDVLQKIMSARGQAFALSVTTHPRLKSCFVIRGTGSAASSSARAS